MTRREAERLLDCVNIYTSGVVTYQRRADILAEYEQRWGFGEQLSLGGERHRGGHARAEDPATSKVAAEANEPSRRNQCGRLLIELVAAAGRGATADELAARLEGKGPSIPFNSLTRRCSDLKQLGYAQVLAGVERTTRNGGQAEVLVATAKGRHWAGQVSQPEAAGAGPAAAPAA